jgi:hypothetical protein
MRGEDSSGAEKIENLIARLEKKKLDALDNKANNQGASKG